MSHPCGETALEVLAQQAIDLVILDMIMPGGMDGLETYKQVIQLYPYQKAIITSGFSESDRVKELQALGVATYIQKPYSMEKIAVAARKELDRKES